MSRPRAKVTIRLTQAEYSDLVSALTDLDQGSEGPEWWITKLLNAVMSNAEFDPLQDVRVIIGASYRRGQG